MSSYKEKNELLALKLKQIESLKSRYPTLKEIAKESTFKIPLPSGTAFVISLPIYFPNTPPAFFLESGDGQTLSVKPPSNWSPISNLSKVTYEYIEYYSKNPPSFATTAPPPQYSPPPSYYSSTQPPGGNTSPLNQSPTHGQPPPPYTSPVNNNNRNGSVSPIMTYSTSPPNSNTTQQQQQQQQSNLVIQPPNKNKCIIPSLPKSFPELESKTKEELIQLLESEDLDVFLFSLDEYSLMSSQKDKLKVKNEQLIKTIEPLQDEIDILKKELEEQNLVYQQLKQQNQEKNNQKDKISNRFSPSVLYDKLSDAANISEAESDSIANEFLEGNIELKEFKKLFKESRNTFHSRSARKEIFLKQ